MYLQLVRFLAPGGGLNGRLSKELMEGRGGTVALTKSCDTS